MESYALVHDNYGKITPALSVNSFRGTSGATLLDADLRTRLKDRMRFLKLIQNQHAHKNNVAEYEDQCFVIFILHLGVKFLFLFGLGSLIGLINLLHQQP